MSRAKAKAVTRIVLVKSVAWLGLPSRIPERFDCMMICSVDHLKWLALISRVRSSRVQVEESMQSCSLINSRDIPNSTICSRKAKQPRS